MDHPPYRTLRLTSPLASGEDVRRVQVGVKARARTEPITVDGEYGPQTAHAAKATALALGVASSHVTAGLTERAQLIIRDPDKRTFVERYRAKQRAKVDHDHGASGAVAWALELADRNPHVTESPAGSNRGPFIDIMQREVGMIAQPWCGAFVHYVLQHGGGIVVTPEVRYCPYTEAHAKNGTGGFLRWIPAARAEEAPVGSLVLYGAREAVHVEILVAKSNGSSVSCVGGNTSAGDGGSQANGGGIFRRTRPITGGFPVRGFAVPRGL